MQSMSISKFKATCLAVLERVRRTGEPVQVTKFGRPIAEIIPAAPRAGDRRLGTLRGQLGTTRTDLAPEESGWEGGEEETIREWDELNAEPVSRRAKRPPKRS
jgi:prevent-host-death family protein